MLRRRSSRFGDHLGCGYWRSVSALSHCWQALELLAAHENIFAPLVTHSRPLAEIGQAFDQLEHYRDGVGKIVMVP